MMEPTPNEYHLLRRVQEGDREALQELVERTRLRLFAIAYHELRHYEDAQDAVASALVNACLHLASLRQPGRFHDWLHRIVRNEARMLRRQRRTHSVVPLESYREMGTDGQEGLSSLRLDIEHALQQLPRDVAHAISLFYLGGFTIQEIAGRTGRPEGTIKRWLHDGRRRLAEEMKGYHPMTVTTPPSAALLSTELSKEEQQKLVEALTEAGFGTVHLLSELPPLEWKGLGGTLEYHLPEPLKQARLIVLDEWIGGRSSLEKYVMLRATSEGRTMGVCQLLASPQEVTIFAAWAAGCDMCFTKESLDPKDFARLVKRWLMEKQTTAV